MTTTPTPPPPLSEDELLAVTTALGPGYKFPSCQCGDCRARYRTLLDAIPSLLASARRCAELEAFLAEHGEAVEAGLTVALDDPGICGEEELSECRATIEAFRKLRGTQ